MKDIKTICVVGLGYVGLPLAAAFSKFYNVIGYDKDRNRISELNDGIDKTGELSESDVDTLKNIEFVCEIGGIEKSDVFIITVPTPVDEAQIPDLSYLISASEDVASILQPGGIVIFESTVYPGVTEDVCAPIIEKISKLAFNSEFFVGYSPERINPSDKSKPLSEIVKVTSGSNEATADLVDQLYEKIINAGTHRASSIKVAEASKIIENVQRDVNIALMNELAMILRGLDIDIYEVTQAASTKWNFLKFTPGLVGGHCIGIDPYYLAHKALSMGIYPEIISASRRRNEDMAFYIASRIMQQINLQGLNKRRVMVAGFTFKENCPDTRNTKIYDLVRELSTWGCRVDVYDPLVEQEERDRLSDIHFCETVSQEFYDCVVLAVNHERFKAQKYGCIIDGCQEQGFIFDLKNALHRIEVGKSIVNL